MGQLCLGVGKSGGQKGGLGCSRGKKSGAPQQACGGRWCQPARQGQRGASAPPVITRQAKLPAGRPQARPPSAHQRSRPQRECAPVEQIWISGADFWLRVQLVVVVVVAITLAQQLALAEKRPTGRPAAQQLSVAVLVTGQFRVRVTQNEARRCPVFFAG